MAKWVVIICLSAVVLFGLIGWGVYRAVTGTSTGLILSGGAVGSGKLVENLSSDDRDLVMTSLHILRERRDPAGVAKARTLLESTDDCIWFNAAIYLGAVGDADAIPYLIKGLKHPAYRSYPEVAAELHDLTGESFGVDQAKWIAWWEKAKPGAVFSFEYASLKKQSEEIVSASNILINHVIDPVHVSFSGSPILLIGVRVKSSTPVSSAQTLLETGILGQFAEIERDGLALTPDGSVPAVITWEPDPINGPDTAAVLRSGLGAVPFTRKTCIQRYLLDSGLYELDVSNVHDAKLRAELASYVKGSK